MAKKTKKEEAAVVTKEKAKAGKGAKATPAANGDTPRNRRDEQGLTGNERKVLEVLAKSKRALSRNELSEATGIVKGWAKMLGAATKAEEQGFGDQTLEGRGLVESEKPEEGERGFRYSITPKGRALLLK